MVRFTRRPRSAISFQFMNESLTRIDGGMVAMVLSKLRTFTVVSDTFCTTPSTPSLLMVIQSPGFSISFTLS